MTARIAVAEHVPPCSVASWREKQRLNSNSPRGVAMYLPFCYPAHRRFMDPELLGNLLQHERFHRGFSILEEVALPRDDRLGNALYRHEALLDVAHQPPCFLKLARMAPLPEPLVMAAYDGLMRTRGSAPVLAFTTHFDRTFSTTTSGTT